MHRSLTRRGYLVNIKKLSSKQQKAIDGETIFQPLLSVKLKVEPDPISLCQHITKKGKPTDFMLIPKITAQNIVGPPIKINKEVKGQSMPKTSRKFIGTFRDKQVQPANQALELLKSDGGAVLHLPTSYGKTFIFIWLATKLARKTMVVVNKQPLFEQTLDNIKRFCPKARVHGWHEALKKSKTFGKSDFVVVMLQTLTRNIKKFKKNNKFFDPFGTLIVDEAHNIGAPKSSRVLKYIVTQYSLGVSATPFRSDGSSRILSAFLGRICNDVAVHDALLQPRIACFVRYNGSIDPKKPDAYRKPVKEGPTGYTDAENLLSKNRLRNTFIAQLALDVYRTRRSRNILIVCGRKTQAQTVYELILTILTHTPYDLKNNEALNAVGLLMGGRSSSKAAKAHADKEKSKKILVAMKSIVTEGFDVPHLDTLIRASPGSGAVHAMNSMVQMSGRIFRKLHKNTPLIVEIDDNYGIWHGQCRSRNKNFYQPMRYNVEYHTVDDDAIELLNESKRKKYVKNVSKTKYKSNATYIPTKFIRCKNIGTSTADFDIVSKDYNPTFKGWTMDLLELARPDEKANHFHKQKYGNSYNAHKSGAKTALPTYNRRSDKDSTTAQVETVEHIVKRKPVTISLGNGMQVQL